VRLVDLHPRWVGAGGEGITNADGSPTVARHGVGVSFDCPCGCDQRAFIPFEPALDGKGPHWKDGQHWDRDGDTFDALTLKPSIQHVGGCKWHGFITNGEAEKCG
jgi:hypothetical protein